MQLTRYALDLCRDFVQDRVALDAVQRWSVSIGRRLVRFISSSSSGHHGRITSARRGGHYCIGIDVVLYVEVLVVRRIIVEFLFEFAHLQHNF